MLGFTNRGGMQTSISVPVKGFFSKFGCELHWGVVQLGQDHGAPPAPCRGAQGCTWVHRVHKVLLVTLTRAIYGSYDVI